MTPDSVDSRRLEADVEALRDVHADTRTLYREVCGLLFFRYGITPTTNKLYQLVRKGSMGTPAQALQQFWQDLRARSQVVIDHPELPDALKQVAAEAVQTIWRAANDSARTELAAIRDDMEAGQRTAQAELDRAREELASARAALAASVQACEQLREDLRELRGQVAEARGAEAEALTHRESLQAELAAAHEQTRAARDDFMAEGERIRQQLNAIEARSDAAVRRAQLELDQERTARRQSEQGLAATRAEVDRLRDAQRQDAVTAAEVLGSFQAQAQAAHLRCEELMRAQDAVQRQLASASEAITAVSVRAERAEAERDLARELLASPRDGLNKGRSGARRKSAD